MKLTEAQKERLLLMHAILMTVYLERRPPPGADPAEAQEHGNELAPGAARAIGRYLMDRKEEVVSLENGVPMLSWVDEHLEEALGIAIGAQSINEQLREQGAGS